MSNFYLVKYTDCSSDHVNDYDNDRVEIRTKPKLYNLTGQECICGWCGTKNDISVTAYGDFESYDLALAELEDEFPDVIDSDNLELNPYFIKEDDVLKVFVYKIYE